MRCPGLSQPGTSGTSVAGAATTGDSRFRPISANAQPALRPCPPFPKKPPHKRSIRASPSQVNVLLPRAKFCMASHSFPVRAFISDSSRSRRFAGGVIRLQVCVRCAEQGSNLIHGRGFKGIRGAGTEGQTPPIAFASPPGARPSVPTENQPSRALRWAANSQPISGFGRK